MFTDRDNESHNVEKQNMQTSRRIPFFKTRSGRRGAPSKVLNGKRK